MELILQILILFICVNCLIKLSFWKAWQTVLFGLLCALFVWFSQSYIITLSKTKFEALLQDTKVLQDLAVWITAESALCFGFCIVALRRLFGKTKLRKAMILYAYPGLLIFPVLIYIQAQLVFGLPGVDFEKIALYLTIAVLLFIPLGAWGVKLLFPEPELKLEIHFLLSLIICITGLLMTVNGNTTYKPIAQETDYKDMALTFLLFAGLFLSGWVFTRLKTMHRNKRIQKSK